MAAGRVSWKKKAAPTATPQMHPRNRYKDEPPDVASLAQAHPELRPYLRDEGKQVAYDFDDPAALRYVQNKACPHASLTRAQCAYASAAARALWRGRIAGSPAAVPSGT